MDNFEIIFYDLPDGTKPAKEFVKSIDNKKLKAKVYVLIDMLRANGYNLREPYSKSLEDGIFELRAKVGSNITRILYFFVIEKKIVLTNGFVKKTQKTPPDEIIRAKKYRQEYLQREVKDYE